MAGDTKRQWPGDLFGEQREQRNVRHNFVGWKKIPGAFENQSQHTFFFRYLVTDLTVSKWGLDVN